MKKYLIAIGIIAILLIVLSYIGDISEENEKKRLFEESRQQKQTESSMDQLMKDIKYYENHPELLLSIEAALEDYIDMWRELENYYPYFGVAERLHGVKYREVKETYLEYINNKTGLGVLPMNINQ